MGETGREVETEGGSEVGGWQSTLQCTTVDLGAVTLPKYLKITLVMNVQFP